ncbi:ABC transporter ATP-binding protein [Azospirillum brasilense]|uniref:Spermidine/putrescine import ATP-binding protein PotA n=1 Tax=Azospirillum brasilense TaxID=192 RepID=A0A6L3B5G3_AZOBR|nr:ABC transporter ATP-binding protein [Azospirillum brasilense]KAA0687609.1 ABC transporter ATP-binding protein [Azospirillum brasilense]
MISLPASAVPAPVPAAASVAASAAVAPAAAMVELRAITKRYGRFEALQRIDLSIAKGEFVTLLGPSGSGKTTLLNLIAGMIVPSSGQIVIDGRDATGLPTNRRGLGMVFQNYALMPHMTVFENIAFPLQVRGLPKSEIKRKVADVLDLIQLGHVADRRPRELSGGQQQRVSLARCIVYNPALILMDEPLGALDKKLREQMQLEIKRLHAELGITMLYVTHDQDEALTMSDRIVLMNGGRIEQEGPPDALYFKPKTVFSAEFIGSSNLIPGEVEAAENGTVMLRTALGRFPVPAPDRPVCTGESAVLLVRPENMELSDRADPTSVAGRIEDSILLGGVVRHFVRCTDGSTVIVQELNQPGRAGAHRDGVVRARWNAEHGRLLPSPPAR